MTKTKLLILLILSFWLVACDGQPTAKQIKAQGEKYATIQASNQAALDAEQARIAEANAEAYKQERRAYWSLVWQKSINAVVISMYIIILGMGISTSSLIWNTQKAFSHFVTLRASLLPVQDNGVRPALVFPTQRSLLESITYDKAFRITDTKYHLVDAQTGEHALIDLNKPATAPGMEILRQALLLYVPARQQRRTALASGDGKVAHAIGESTLDIPENHNVINLEEIKQALLTEATDVQ